MESLISFGLVSLLIATGFALAPLMLLALAIPYAVLRLRTDGAADGQLGLKVALYFFISASMLLALTGATLIAADLAARDGAQPRAAQDEISLPSVGLGGGSSSGFNANCRTGLALMICGVVGWIAHHVLLKKTTPVNQVRIHRTFVGFRFAISGLALCGALTLLVVLMLQENAFQRPAFSLVRSVIGIVVVWLPAWLLHLGLIFQAGRAQVREGA